MIERTTARQWLLVALAGLVLLVLWQAIPTADPPVGVIGGVLLVSGLAGIAWRLLKGQ